MDEIGTPRPLRETDDRTHFDCGRDSLNGWFRRHGWNNHAAGVSRVNVLCHLDTGEIIAYVSLSSAQIERAFLPKSRQRNQPDPMPVTLLGQLAVDKTYQRQGHAAALLTFALRTALKASETIGSIGVIAHPLDDAVRQLYLKWGFEDLPHDPHRAMIVRVVDLRANGFDQ